MVFSNMYAAERMSTKFIKVLCAIYCIFAVFCRFVRFLQVIDFINSERILSGTSGKTTILQKSLTRVRVGVLKKHTFSALTARYTLTTIFGSSNTPLANGRA